jgi:hypothetical protein
MGDGGVGVARVVAVHGIAKTYGAGPVMAADWVPALVGGVELAGGNGVLASDDVSCVFYGDVFRRPGRMLGDEDVDDAPGDDLDERELELIAAWWAEAAAVDSWVMPPDARTLGVQRVLAVLAGSRFLAGTTERLLIVWTRQVRAYFTRPDVREEVQRRFATAIGPDTRVVVAHSLGSVVAYEALCAHPEWQVRTLVTLGSPLGIHTVVLDRLNPPPARVGSRVTAQWPGGIQSWTNIADRMDFVALVKKLGTVFGESIADIEITNGAKMHDVRRYLTARETGAAILAGLG